MIIKHGTHSTLRFPKIISGNGVKYKITFTESCRYFIGEDQSDINKLFGIGYFPHHRYLSARFGWRYDIASGMIEVLTYRRMNWDKTWTSLGLYFIGKEYIFELCRPNAYKKWYLPEHCFNASEANGNDFRTTNVYCPPQQYGYLLGPYFGGNQKAPHDIEIIMQRI